MIRFYFCHNFLHIITRHNRFSGIFITTILDNFILKIIKFVLKIIKFVTDNPIMNYELRIRNYTLALAKALSTACSA
jgi:hypothetical protein